MTVVKGQIGEIYDSFQAQMGETYDHYLGIHWRDI